MSEDVKIKLVDGVSHSMAVIFNQPDKAFQWVPEASTLMQKWVDEKGHFGLDGVVDALLWWQDHATEENPYPLTKELA